MVDDIYAVPELVIDSDETDALHKWSGIDGPPLKDEK